MIVLDASALVDVVLDQPNRAQVLAHLDQPIAAPAHQPVEALRPWLDFAARAS